MLAVGSSSTRPEGRFGHLENAGPLFTFVFPDCRRSLRCQRDRLARLRERFCVNPRERFIARVHYTTGLSS